MASTYPVTSATIDSQPPSAHHIHTDSERLPTNLANDATMNNTAPPTAGQIDALPDPPTAHIAPSLDAASTHSTLDGDQSASDPNFGLSEARSRPLGTKSVPAGGVARDANENLGNSGTGEELPAGKAGLADKIVGKVEKVTGKLKKDPELQEKGELREAGGKGAATGDARAPHD